MSKALIEDLRARGLIFQIAGEERFIDWLEEKPRTLYCGFDPTADSLHIGSLVPLLMLRRFQDAGHKPIALVGGATGLIGDPSFKAQERQLNTPDVVGGWVDKLKAQVSRFISFDESDSSAIVVNNLDWTANIDVLTFLRDIGKHFSINAMIQKESVKQRIEREGSGISYTEFTYMILQSYDFAELNKRFDCTLQIGGSDQWGNITGGIDLTRRMHQNQVYGLTMPLITKSDGSKFGKSESGTIWMDPAKTSPYAFYQFWLNTADADVYRFMHFFTFLGLEEIEAIRAADAASGTKPEAQGILAQEVTRLVHGDAGLAAAQRISSALFSGDIASLTESDLAQLAQDGLPTTDSSAGTITELLVATELAKSNKMAREFLGNNAVSVNGVVVSDGDSVLGAENALHGRYFVLRRGKKLFHLIRLV